MKRLIDAREEAIVRVVDVIADNGMKKAYYELGVVPGSRLKLLLNNHVVIVERNGSKLCLSKTLAEKVLVVEE